MLKENRIHGTGMFPIATYMINCNIGEKILDCHWHNEWEFLLVTAGKAIFQVETSYYEVHSGQAVFINGGNIHAGYPQQNSSCTYCAIVFDPILLCSNSFDILQIKFVDPLIKGQYVLPEFISGSYEWEKTVMQCIKKIFNACMDGQPAYELVVKAELLFILSEFVKNNKFYMNNKLCLTSYKSTQMKKILNYIHLNYSKKINIKILCEQISVSQGYFCRFFKQMMRQTAIEYINRYRINIAAKLLSETDQKILEVALGVGFDNLSYFHSIFKRHMNCTPLEYRKNEKVFFNLH